MQSKTVPNTLSETQATPALDEEFQNHRSGSGHAEPEKFASGKNPAVIGRLSIGGLRPLGRAHTPMGRSAEAQLVAQKLLDASVILCITENQLAGETEKTRNTPQLLREELGIVLLSLQCIAHNLLFFGLYEASDRPFGRQCCDKEILASGGGLTRE